MLKEFIQGLGGGLGNYLDLLCELGCYDPEMCDGAGSCPGSSPKTLGSSCGDTGDSTCDHADECDGGGVCLPMYETDTDAVCAPEAGCYTLIVTDGSFPGEVSWSITGDAFNTTSGGPGNMTRNIPPAPPLLPLVVP